MDYPVDLMFNSGWEKDAVITTASDSITVLGYFTENYSEDKTDNTEFASTYPAFSCSSSSIEGIKEGDGFACEGQSYIIKLIKKDSKGFALIILEYDYD